MKIVKDTVVTLRYKVIDADSGKLLEDGKQASSYLHGGYGNTFDKVEQALAGQEPGYQIALSLAAQDAFGVRDESLVQTIPKSQFPPGVKVGGQLEGRSEDGRSMAFTVVKVKGPLVHLDGNHPLAGKSLRLEIVVLEVRPASQEEIAHGHAHGAHGHHH